MSRERNVTLLTQRTIAMTRSPRREAPTIKIPWLEDRPYMAALNVFAFLAYPNDDEVENRCRCLDALTFAWQIRDADRPLARLFTEEKFKNILTKAHRRIDERLSAARIAYQQIFEMKKEGFEPTLDNLEQFERIRLGWNSDSVTSHSTFISKVWMRSRPVLHLATAFFWEQILNYPADFQQLYYHFICSPKSLIVLLETAENIRIGLPFVNRMYRLGQFLKFEIEAGANLKDVPQIYMDRILPVFNEPTFNILHLAASRKIKRKSRQVTA